MCLITGASQTIKDIWICSQYIIESENAYEILQWDLLSVIFAVLFFKDYLEGSTFTVHGDHEASDAHWIWWMRKKVGMKDADLPEFDSDVGHLPSINHELAEPVLHLPAGGADESPLGGHISVLTITDVQKINKNRETDRRNDYGLYWNKDTVVINQCFPMFHRK